MNNEVYKRLSALFEKLGFPIDNGTKEKGELLAYCTAINTVQGELEENFAQMLADTSSGLGLSLFCELLGIDGTLSDEEKYKLIKEGLSQKYGDYIFGTMTSEIEGLADGFSMTADDFKITINGSIKSDTDILARLGKILEKYLLPCTVIAFCGDGIDFDYWDSTPYLFEDYDNLNLSFSVLDTLE
ncbi:MAG: hypothetical protein J1E36_05970 [Eubacterium sp.]|nr:hypothetical protein [Eubacterium sp.]